MVAESGGSGGLGLQESDLPPPPLLNGPGHLGASVWGHGNGDPQFVLDLVSILGWDEE